MTIQRAALDRRMLFSWNGAFENWSRAYVAKNFWRVRSLFGSEEDAVQECAVIFTRCLNYYADKVDNPAWMMALYKRAVANDFHTFALKDQQARSVGTPLADPDATLPEIPDYSAGPLFAQLAVDASGELRQVLTMIANAPAEMLEIIFASRSEAAINRRLRRICRLPENRDLLGELRALLTK